MGSTVELVGVTIAAYPLASLIASPVVGAVSARFGPGATATAGGFILSAGTLLFGLSGTIGVAMAARAVQGVGAAAVYIR
jgi:MFS family permease